MLAWTILFLEKMKFFWIKTIIGKRKIVPKVKLAIFRVLSVEHSSPPFLDEWDKFWVKSIEIKLFLFQKYSPYTCFLTHNLAFIRTHYWQVLKSAQNSNLTILQDRVSAEVVRSAAQRGLREHRPGVPVQLQHLGARVHQVPWAHPDAAEEQPQVDIYRHPEQAERLHIAGPAEAARRNVIAGRRS